MCNFLSLFWGWRAIIYKRPVLTLHCEPEQAVRTLLFLLQCAPVSQTYLSDADRRGGWGSEDSVLNNLSLTWWRSIIGDVRWNISAHRHCVNTFFWRDTCWVFVHLSSLLIIISPALIGFFSFLFLLFIFFPSMTLTTPQASSHLVPGFQLCTQEDRSNTFFYFRWCITLTYLCSLWVISSCPSCGGSNVSQILWQCSDRILVLSVDIV